MLSPPLRAGLIATGWFVLLALVLVGPALSGRVALLPESIVDVDPLFRPAAPAAPPRFNDLTSFEVGYPRELAFARGLHAGRLDAWNPDSALGVPLWAEQGGPFFPLKLPFYLAPSPRTYDLFLALRLVVAGLGAYLLARQRGLAPIPATAAGASFELCGALVAAIPFGTASAVYVLPWLILAAGALARRRSPATIGGAALAVGAAASGGHPTLILLVLLAFGVAIVAPAIARWRTPRLAVTVVAGGACAGVLGLALAAPSLLPLGELTGLGLSYKDRPLGPWSWRWQLDNSRLSLPIAWFAPGLLEPLYGLGKTLFVSAPAVGVLTLVLAALGMWWRRLEADLAAVLAVGVVLSTMPPGFVWLHALPGVELILPPYGWPLVLLPVTQAAGRGVAALSTGGEPRRAPFLLASLWLALGGLTLLLLPASIWQTFPHPLARPSAISTGERLLRCLLPAAFAIGVLALLLARQRRGALRWAALYLTVAMSTEQLVTMAPLVWEPVSNALAIPPSPAVQFLQHRLADGTARFAGLPVSVGRPMLPMLYGLPDGRGVSALPVGRYYEYLHALSPKAGDFTLQQIGALRSPLLDLAAVRYLVFARTAVPPPPHPLLADHLLAPPEQPALDRPDLPQVYDDQHVLILENRTALPRVRIAHRAQRVADRPAALEWARRTGAATSAAAAPGLDGAVVLEPDEQGQDPAEIGGAQTAGEQVRLLDVSDPDRLIIEAELATDGYVVVADTYYPGWEARVDGRATAIYPADLLFRALFVPAGRHRLELEYRPRSLRLGMWLFAAAALTCAGLLWSSRHSRRCIGRHVLGPDPGRRPPAGFVARLRTTYPVTPSVGRCAADAGGPPALRAWR